MWKLAPKVISLLGVLLCLTLTQPRLLSQSVSAPKITQLVQLAVNYGDGVEKRFTLPYKKEMSVLDAMKAAQSNAHGIKFETKTYPHGEFVTQIDDLANEGSGPNQKNWLYSVNGIDAEAGIDANKLKPSDKIAWRYVVSQPHR